MICNHWNIQDVQKVWERPIRVVLFSIDLEKLLYFYKNSTVLCIGQIDISGIREVATVILFTEQVFSFPQKHIEISKIRKVSICIRSPIMFQRPPFMSSNPYFLESIPFYLMRFSYKIDSTGLTLVSSWVWRW